MVEKKERGNGKKRIWDFQSFTICRVLGLCGWCGVAYAVLQGTGRVFWVPFLLPWWALRAREKGDRGSGVKK